MYSKGTALAVTLAFLLFGLAACRADGELASSNGALPLDRSAWLGSAEGWGLLGLPTEGGALTYRSARYLESPTWAPPELNPLLKAWPGRDAIWLQFADARIGLYDYSTGHLRTFEDFSEETTAAVALDRLNVLVAAVDDGSLTPVGGPDPWRYELGGRLIRLVTAEAGNTVAVVEAESGSEILVLPPSGGAPIGRVQVPGVQDLVVPAWGGQLYYLSNDPSDLELHMLTLPKLERAGSLQLPEPARAVGVTPSGHRVYVAAGPNLYIYNRLDQELIGQVALPGLVSSLRFGVTGTNLLARLDGENRVVVLQVGVDSVLGVVDAEWDRYLPVALPGGRLVTRIGSELVLHDLPGLTRIAAVEESERRLWLAVEWHPPRPKTDLGRRTPTDAQGTRVASGGRGRAAGSAADADSVSADTVAPPGYYAVVSAARTSEGVKNVVTWLGSVGYPAELDRHQDVMGVVWYRAMVGPYRSRPRAEAAGRSLGARYGYKPWILSIDDPESRPTSQPDSIARMGAASAGTEEPGESRH